MIKEIKTCPICHKKCEYIEFHDEFGIVEFDYKCKCGGLSWAYGRVDSKIPKWYKFIKKYRYKKYIKENYLD